MPEQARGEDYRSGLLADVAIHDRRVAGLDSGSGEDLFDPWAVEHEMIIHQFGEGEVDGSGDVAALFISRVGALVEVGEAGVDQLLIFALGYGLDEGGVDDEVPGRFGGEFSWCSGCGGGGGDGFAGGGPGGKAAIEQRRVVGEAEVVEGENYACGGLENLLGSEVDDDAGVVADAEGFELGAEGLGSGEFEGELLGIAGTGDVVEGDVAGSGDVAGVVGVLGADVEEDEVAVVEVGGEPVDVDEHGRGGLGAKRRGG